MKKALTNIGRYYLAGSEFILDLVEIVGNDVMVRWKNIGFIRGAGAVVGRKGRRT